LKLFDRSDVLKLAKDAFDQFLEMFDRHRQVVMHLCDSPATLDRMAAMSTFYADKLKGTIVQDVFERNMIQKNLELLVRDGLVAEAGGVFQRVQ
jgi:hypothetical protein